MSLSVVHPYKIKTGDRVEYNNKMYYFKSKGSAGYLFNSMDDLEEDRNRQYAVARSSVKMYVPNKNTNISTISDAEVQNLMCNLSKLLKEERC